MATRINRIEARGVYGRFNLALEFRPDLNVLYGRNGSGKTTLLHILANAMNGSFDRFAFLRFGSIKIETDSGVIQLVRHESELRVSYNDARVVLDCDAIRRADRQREPAPKEVSGKDLPVWAFSRPSYFPAFRTMIEAWSSVDDDLRRHRRMYDPDVRVLVDAEYGAVPRTRSGRLTSLARTLFGQFTPTLDYPSPIDIERELGDEMHKAALRSARHSQEVLSTAFIDAFAALGEPEDARKSPPEAVLTEIRSLLAKLDETDLPAATHSSKRSVDLYAKLREILPQIRAAQLPGVASSILYVYRQALREQVEVQQSAFEPIRKYIAAVNDFLEDDKALAVAYVGPQSEPWVRVQLGRTRHVSLRSLSSGERQIVAMLYAALHGGTHEGPVLIDEPELSLHIDWQHKLLRKMEPHLSKRQLIVCTHSPEIAADHEDSYQKLVPELLPIDEDPPDGQ